MRLPSLHSCLPPGRWLPKFRRRKISTLADLPEAAPAWAEECTRKEVVSSQFSVISKNKGRGQVPRLFCFCACALLAFFSVRSTGTEVRAIIAKGCAQDDTGAWMDL